MNPSAFVIHVSSSQIIVTIPLVTKKDNKRETQKSLRNNISDGIL